MAVQAALALAFVLVLGASSLLYPFGRDQGEHAYIAAAALDGQVVYRDVFNTKPPLTHVVHQMALLAFGRSMIAIRVLDLLWQAATALVILLIANRAYRRPGVGVLAAIVYALSYHTFDFWSTAQTDGFLNLPVALGVLAFLIARERRAPWGHLAAGAALGVAVLFKYPIGILLPLLALLTVLARERGRLRRVAALGLGFCLPVAIGALALAWQGALADYVFIQFRFIPRYTGEYAQEAYLASVLRQLGHLRWHNVLLWLAAVAVACELACAHRRQAWRQSLPIVLWWLAALASYALQNKGFPYHALPLLAPQAIVVAHLAVVTRDQASLPKPARLALIGLVETFVLTSLMIGLMRGYPHRYGAALVDVVLGKRSLAAVYQDPTLNACGEPGFSVAAQMEAAGHIASRTEPGDQVFIWGFEPTIYFLSHRPCASRFVNNFGLYGGFAWPELREEFQAELVGRAPRYVVVASKDAHPLVTGTGEDSRAALAGFAGLREMIASQYRFEAVVENLTLYRRKE